MKEISIDVMVSGGTKYYGTLKFMWDFGKILTEKKVHSLVVSKYPTLKYEKFTVAFNR
ncbi:hypothetical protein SAMN04487851_11411 [Prevotella sp. tc2-28]|uniref:hypothetical protein n=1 Tax=Prevotella sp. tc2-28 TaxID=1761888 RepID=UPI00089B4BA1|nr:hypothetical protein [Prevotella sp. tc2-28]SEA78603.1 hypothetical protein SAMN04487851_11411 [Prevotella sp. tc2-28]